jgi:hypothetical protein
MASGVVGELISAGTTSAQVITITNLGNNQNKPIDHIIKIVSGTWKFGIGAVPGTAHSYTTDSGNNVAIINCYPGQLWAQASNAADTITVS